MMLCVASPGLAGPLLGTAVLAEGFFAGLPDAVSLTLLGVAALVAGVINSMAGGGSLLVIPLLIAYGLPPSIANGTLRLGILSNAGISILTFRREGLREGRAAASLLLPLLIGTGVGAWLATRVPDAHLRLVFGGLLALWAVLLVIRPGRFLREQGEPHPPSIGVLLVTVAVGVYGGFLQAGVGFPLLALGVLGLGRSTVEANAIKAILVTAYTVLALGIFIAADQVAWVPAVAAAIGGAAGGWIGARWQVRSGVGLVRWVLVVSVAAAAIAMFL